MRLSVITSVYRSDNVQYVREALESLFFQTYRAFDVHLMCDGSIPMELSRFLESVQDPRFHLYKRSENRGLAATLNELLDLVLKDSSVEYIARMDADDISMPHRFETQIGYLDRNPQIDIVGSFITESLDPTQPGGRLVTYPTEHAGMRKIFGKRNPLAHPSVLFRRSFFTKAGGYPTHGLRDEDTQLWINGFLTGCIFSNIPEVLLKMRVTDDFFKRRSGRAKSRNDYLIRKKVIESLRLPRINNIYAYLRYLLFAYAPPAVLKLAYRILR